MVAPSRYLVDRLPSDLREAQRLYHDVTKGLKCKDLLHVRHESCTAAYLDMVLAGAWGTARFFSVFYLINIALNYKKALAVDKQFYKEVVFDYIRGIAAGAAIASTYVLTACPLSRLINGFNFWISSFIPGVFAGLGILIENPARRTIDMNAVYNAALQYGYLRIQLMGYLPRSAEGETITFMVFNAILLYLLATTPRKPSAFWFYIPERVKAVDDLQVEQNCCVPHDGSCWASAIKATQKYITFTAGLQACRILVTEGRKIFNKPSIFFNRFLTRNTFTFVASIGGYVFLYKALRCLLAKWFGKDYPRHSAQAGLVAGAMFWLKPNHTIMSSAIVATIKLLYERVPKQTRPSDKWLIGEIVFALCIGLLFHARLMDMKNCPEFINRMTDTATHNRSKIIENAFLQRAVSLNLI